MKKARAGSAPETLMRLVRQSSPTGKEERAVGYLVERMKTLGYTKAFSDRAGNAVGVMGDGPRQLVLLGHIDTVPGRIPVRVEAGKLYGRGSVDAKGSLAAFVDAVGQLGPVSGWQLVVIGAVDEEGDSAGARHALGQYSPEFLIVGEPSGWQRVTLGYKGSAWSEVTVWQDLAHSASGRESAAEAAVRLWLKIRGYAEEFNQGRERLFDRLLPSLRGLDSGGDGLHEWASLRFGMRLPPDLPPEAWYRQLDEIAAGAEVRRLGFAVPACECEKNTPLVRAFLSAIRSQGGSPGFVYKTGTSDLNVAAPHWDCPALVYGPGDSALDHTPQEHIELEEYDRAVQVLHMELLKMLAAQLPVDTTG